MGNTLEFLETWGRPAMHSCSEGDSQFVSICTTHRSQRVCVGKAERALGLPIVDTQVPTYRYQDLLLCGCQES